MLKIAKYSILCACVLALMFLPARAAPITGTLNVTGSVSVGLTTIEWQPLSGGGQFTVDPSSTGTFAAFIGQEGTAKNLDVSIEPVGSTFSLPDFLVLPGISFTLTFIAPGVFSATDCFAPPAPGQVCTPPFPAPKSPFDMTNTANGATVAMSVAGTVMGTDGIAQPFRGVYTTQFVGQNFQQLLADIQAGTKVNASYSANFVATVIPEPSAIYLATSGLLLLAGGAFVRRRMRY